MNSPREFWLCTAYPASAIRCTLVRLSIQSKPGSENTIANSAASLTKFSLNRTPGLMDNFFPINDINIIAREQRQLYLIANKATEIELHPKVIKRKIDSPSEDGKSLSPTP
jgi:hypothetical protein